MAKLTQEDIEFMKWLDRPDNAAYWVIDRNGEKVMMREGWDKAFEEYTRIKQIKDSGLPPLKFRKTLNECQLFPGNEQKSNINYIVPSPFFMMGPQDSFGERCD